jgi:hypothetical protein
MLDVEVGGKKLWEDARKSELKWEMHYPRKDVGTVSLLKIL